MIGQIPLPNQYDREFGHRGGVLQCFDCGHVFHSGVSGYCFRDVTGTRPFYIPYQQVTAAHLVQGPFCNACMSQTELYGFHAHRRCVVGCA